MTRRSFWLILAALGAIRLALMATVPVFEPSEARYAAIAANMARTGDFTVPRFTHVHFTLGTNGQTFTIERHGEGERIQRITCNGKPLKGWFVPHDKLAAGATLTIDVEPAPADAPFLQ